MASDKIEKTTPELQNIKSSNSDFKETFIIGEKLKPEDRIIQEGQLKQLIKERGMITLKTRFYILMHEMEKGDFYSSQQKESLKNQIIKIYEKDKNEESSYLVGLYYGAYEEDIIKGLEYFRISLDLGDRKRKDIKKGTRFLIKWIKEDDNFESDENFNKISLLFGKYLLQFLKEHLNENSKELKENEIKNINRAINLLSK